MKLHRFHVLGFPHTATNAIFNACAYTAKTRKFIKMMAARGHELVHYGNEGSEVGCEHVQVLTEQERQSWFGEHDPNQQYGVGLLWDPSLPYWRVFNERASFELMKRVRPGDFILTLAGLCQKPIADCFPGSYSGTCQTAWFVEYGIGYYGTFSQYRVYESNTHREWCQGAANNKGDDPHDAVVHNYFDLAEFTERLCLGEEARKIAAPFGNYYVFVGRLNEDKGWRIAADATREIGARLVLVGQGDVGKLEDHVVKFGHANAEQRAALLGNAVASFAPTRYREPFGGVAVEAQLCGTPCISSDHGAFVETVEPEWRCSGHREFVDAAIRAGELHQTRRARLQDRARARWSLQAIAPQYERYFNRLHLRWGAGWYEMRDPESVGPG